jgi:hypothetical protein
MSIVLNKSQIKVISKLIEMKGVNHIDVNLELTDHIATEIEELISKNPSINFTTAVKTIFLKYSRFHFMKIEEEKEKQIRKIATKDILKEFISFFTIPKIIFTFILFFYIKHLLSIKQMNEYIIGFVFIFSVFSPLFLVYYH